MGRSFISTPASHSFVSCSTTRNPIHVYFAHPSLYVVFIHRAGSRAFNFCLQNNECRATTGEKDGGESEMMQTRRSSSCIDSNSLFQDLTLSLYTPSFLFTFVLPDLEIASTFSSVLWTPLPPHYTVSRLMPCPIREISLSLDYPVWQTLWHIKTA